MVDFESIEKRYRRGICKYKYDYEIKLVSKKLIEFHNKDEALSISYGADDYVTKPYNPEILLLRIGAVLKRTKLEKFFSRAMRLSGSKVISVIPE